MISFGDDDNVIPIIEFEQVGPFLCGNELARHLFAIFIPNRLLTGETDATPFAAFVIDEASNVRHFRFIPDLVLIATDDPGISRFALGDVLGPILDSGIVGGVATERQSQFKIFRSAILPDQKRIPIGPVFRCGFTMDRPVFD